MPNCPGKMRSVLAVVSIAVSGGELLAQAGSSYGLDTASASNELAQSHGSNSYGLDTVSDSGFHEEVWNRYGSDPTPQSTTSEGHFRRAAPHPLPAVRGMNTDDLDHVALYRAIQHLTGAVEMTPGPEPTVKTPSKPIKTVVEEPTRPAPRSPSTRANHTYRRWRLFGR